MTLLGGSGLGGKSEAKIRSILYNWVDHKYTHKTVSEHSNMQQCCKQIPLCAVHSWDERRTKMQSKGIQVGIDLCELGAIEQLQGLHLILSHLKGKNFHLRICSCNDECVLLIVTVV